MDRSTKVAEKFSTSRGWIRAALAPVRHWLEHPWVGSVVRLSAVNDTLGGLHPMLSLSEVRARVVSLRDETLDTRTFLLQPNVLWQGARAGQFVRVRVEINGRMLERVYSLSSAPGGHPLAITVRRQEGGLVSNFLHDRVKPGAVLTISQAAGDFVLPRHCGGKLLLFSAGSGITPVMALLRDLEMRRYQGDVVLLHVCRSPDAFIFRRVVENMATRFAALTVRTHFTQSDGRFDVATLQRLVPDFAERESWMCGPLALMDLAHRHWNGLALRSPLHSERFAAPPPFPLPTSGTPVTVALRSSGRTFTTRGGEPLLVQAERAGFAPKHGCRIGICHSCQCEKVSGTVQDLYTGTISSKPDELIRLCVSVARSDVVLDL